jgi:hypothetical protein
MALPTAAPSRQLRHRRRIDVQVFARGNGLWEVDAEITDAKTHDIPLGGGIRRAGEAIHDMLLRIVVDEHFNVLEAGAQSRAIPYPGQCDNHGDAYGRLVGLNLMKGFRRQVLQRLGGVQGCTHITELSQVLPTAVVQAFAGDVIDTRGHNPQDPQPFQIDRCHALRAEGPVVQTFYPRWYRKSGADETTVSKNLSKRDRDEDS